MKSTSAPLSAPKFWTLRLECSFLTPGENFEALIILQFLTRWWFLLHFTSKFPSWRFSKKNPDYYHDFFHDALFTSLRPSSLANFSVVSGFSGGKFRKPLKGVFSELFPCCETIFATEVVIAFSFCIKRIIFGRPTWKGFAIPLIRSQKTRQRIPSK